MILKIKSKSLLPQGRKFDLKYFKKPFCSKEKNNFKRYETVKFKTNYFFIKQYKPDINPTNMLIPDIYL